MTKRTLLVVAAVIAAVLALAFVFQPELFTAAGRQARFLRSLERGPLIVRRNCQSMETFVQGAYWQSMRDGDREQAGRLLAEYCREQGSSGQMTIVDAESKQKLAHWDGSALQKF